MILSLLVYGKKQLYNKYNFELLVQRHLNIHELILNEPNKQYQSKKVEPIQRKVENNMKSSKNKGTLVTGFIIFVIIIWNYA